MRILVRHFSVAAAVALLLTQAALAENLPQGDAKAYSPPVANKSVPSRVLWGDTHLHTGYSFDAGMFGTTLTPEDAFRFARGEEVTSTTGVPAKLSRPYDFLVVSDHSDYLGLTRQLREGGEKLLADPVGRHLYETYNSGPAGAAKAFVEFIDNYTKGTPLKFSPELAKESWARSVAAAEKYNDPGRFTAFIGFEWSAMRAGDNLHRNVIFRDGGDKASQVVPLTTFESSDPESLWRYLADYEQKTGGQVLAIPHNSNLSGGEMFADKTFGGQPFDRAYAEQRAKWEPVTEISQSKGDSETLPILSPEDEFASFERWDRANIINNRLDLPEEQPFNYVRPTLERGLRFEQQLGVNPFKFGVIASSDLHTGLSTVEANNFFGVNPVGEPGPRRLNLPASKFTSDAKNVWESWEWVSSGLAAVWAAENTRESIFDAFRRKEVYGTTGPRITVRVFAGWDFKAGDEVRSDFAAYGYAHGVPMGGDLSGAASGKAPHLVIQAAKDPDGANLDRVQVIKGWLDAKGQIHETVFDVAWSGKRKPGKDGKLPSVGNSVDVANATYSNSIGAPVLDTTWTDPSFDASQRAFYYVRVLQIPTPRWSTYDAKKFGVTIPDKAPKTLSERAYTSPIWYTPDRGA